MTERRRFSDRYETRRPAEGLIYRDVPDRVRHGLMNILTTVRGGVSERLSLHVHRALDRAVPYLPHFDVESDLKDLVARLHWDELCDACEAIWEGLAQSQRDRFSNEVNALFTRNYYGYELRDGQMERVGARVHEEAIAEARGILRDPDLSGPDEQYQKAIGFFNRRPDPDCENCVKEAVSAVEGVARVLLKDDSIVLSDALQQLRKRKGVHQMLIKLLGNLYAYRGDAEGVAHALTGEKEVRVEEAEFVLAISASAIVYLARLFGRGVE